MPPLSRRVSFAMSRMVLALAGILILTSFVVFPASQRANAACLIPAENVAVTAENQSGSNSSTSAWQWFKFTTTLTNLDGMAAGCQASVVLPSAFGSMQSTTLYLQADGTYSQTQTADTVASMAVDPTSNTLTFVLTDYASTHTGVTATGWVTAQLDSSIDRGVTASVDVTVNGTTKSAGTITTPTCSTDCPTVPTDYAGKWGTAYSDGSGQVTIQTPVVGPAGTKAEIKDVLVSANQSLNGIAWVAGYNCVNTWGDPGALNASGVCVMDATVPVSQSGTADDVFLWSSVDNVFFRVGLNMTFTGPGPWTDKATISIGGGEPYETTATVTRYNAGGGGSGEASPTPTPTPTETATPTPTPTETTTPTPTPTETTTPTPTPTETTTPTPTPTETTTPTPTETATPTETTTPTPTETTTPSVTPTPTETSTVTPTETPTPTEPPTLPLKPRHKVIQSG